MNLTNKMTKDRNFERAFRVARETESTVLITGETGTGKSCLARKIHEGSSRRARPFVTVNLACLHEGTIESELFGHERGAFTGADQRRVGRLEAAQGGTVFLDEVGELPPRLQARLLEFLQSRIISPVGSNREVRLDVRVIAATHRNLSRQVERGEFREDLFHRLRVITLSLPSIASRAEEFDAIMHGCLENVCRDLGRSILSISEEVAQLLESHSWPGNFRELRHVLEYAVQASEGQAIGIDCLPDWFVSSHSHAGGVNKPFMVGVAELPVSLDFHNSVEEFEKSYLVWALRRNQCRINRTAREIGLNKTTLLRRLKTLGLSAQSLGSSEQVSEGLIRSPA